MKKKDNICPFSIGDVFLQTYVISKRIKLRIPDTTQMKDLSKGFTGITNFNPFFLCYGSKERFKNPPFFLPPRLCFHNYGKFFLLLFLPLASKPKSQLQGPALRHQSQPQNSNSSLKTPILSHKLQPQPRGSQSQPGNSDPNHMALIPALYSRSRLDLR